MDEVLKTIVDHLLYLIRRDTETIPYKVRITLFLGKEEGGTHYIERETIINVEDYERAYSEWEKKELVRSAADILLNGDGDE